MGLMKHGWIVTQDKLHEEGLSPDLPTRVGWVGPRNISPRIEAQLKAGEGFEWRCKDGAGDVYYVGRYIGPDDERMLAPLYDLAQPDAGATSIEYKDAQTGAWEELW